SKDQNDRFLKFQCFDFCRAPTKKTHSPTLSWMSLKLENHLCLQMEMKIPWPNGKTPDCFPKPKFGNACPVSNDRPPQWRGRHDWSSQRRSTPPTKSG